MRWKYEEQETTFLLQFLLPPKSHALCAIPTHKDISFISPLHSGFPKRKRERNDILMIRNQTHSDACINAKQTKNCK